MEIINTNLNFKAMSNRQTTDRIILHHSASSVASAEQIHSWHLGNGWEGAGYHFLVRKDGKIYRMRPEEKIGAHASGSNYNSIGICFEGNFEVEEMPAVQVQSGKELVAYLKNKYGINKVQGHRDVNKTSCPGKNFKFNEIANGQTPAENGQNTAESPVESGYSYKEFVGDVQKAIGAKVDKIAGPETLSKTVTVSRYINNMHAVIKPIQKYLYLLGYTEVGEADGIAGIKFDTAVKHFQRDNGCVVDGEITARNKTWKKLLKLA